MKSKYLIFLSSFLVSLLILRLGEGLFFETAEIMVHNSDNIPDNHDAINNQVLNSNAFDNQSRSSKEPGGDDVSYSSDEASISSLATSEDYVGGFQDELDILTQEVLENDEVIAVISESHGLSLSYSMYEELSTVAKNISRTALKDNKKWNNFEDVFIDTAMNDAYVSKAVNSIIDWSLEDRELLAGNYKAQHELRAAAEQLGFSLEEDVACSDQACFIFSPRGYLQSVSEEIYYNELINEYEPAVHFYFDETFPKGCTPMTFSDFLRVEELPEVETLIICSTVFK